jgi:hypothetical protein
MAEKRTIELEIQDNTKSLKAQYREAVQELQKVAAAYGETSTQAVNAAKKAAELKDQIEDTNDLLQSFKGEGAFIAMGKAMSAVANGFSAVEGGLGLIGVESENVQATMLKVQSAMALAQGLEGLEDAGRAFKSLGTVIKSTAVGQGLLTIATAAYNFVLNASTTGLKLFRIALISTGIGALVVGVGLLVANFDKLVGFIQKAVTWFSGLSGTMKNIISVIFPFIGLIRLVVAGLEELGIVDDEQAAIKKKNHENDMKRADAAIKKQEEMRKAREKAFNNEQSGYDRAIKLAQAEGKSVTDLQKAKINASIKYQETRKKELEQDLVAYKFAQKFLGELGESLIDTTDIEAKIAELGNNILDQKNDLKILDIEAKKPAAGTGATSSGAGGGTQSTNVDITRRIEDERLRVMDESRAKELAALDLQYKRKKEDAEKELATDKDKLTKLAALNAQAVESKKVDEQRINDKYDKIDKDAATKAAEEKIKLQDEQWLALQKLKNSQQEQELLDLQLAYDKEYELAGTNAELQKALTDKFNKDSAAINKKYRTEEELAKAEADKKEADRIKALNDLRFKAAKDTLQVISNVTELFAGKSKAQQKRAFQIQKAVNIAGATMDTYKAAASALKDSPAPFNFIAMAAVITAGLLNVKKIASQKFEGGGASGGGGGASGGGGAAATMTPQFNVVGNNGINQLAQLQQQPVQAYVVSGEVTTAQSLDRNRVQNATL